MIDILDPGIGVFFFLLGTIIGSFLNVVVLRFGKLSLAGRSMCPNCKTTLTAWELIPVLSFLWLRGRCRTCKKPISPQYPLVELVTGLLFLGCYLVLGLPVTVLGVIAFLLHLVAFSLLVALTVYDIHHTIIPNQFVYAFSVCALLLLFIDPSGMFTVPSLLALLAGPILFLPFFILWIVSKGRWLGLGDGKLALGMGWLLGIAGGFSAVLLAFWIGAVMSIMLLTYVKVGTTHLRGGARHFTMKSEIPFAPFLVLGLILVFFFHLNVIPLMFPL